MPPRPVLGVLLAILAALLPASAAVARQRAVDLAGVVLAHRRA